VCLFIHDLELAHFGIHPRLMHLVCITRFTERQVVKPESCTGAKSVTNDINDRLLFVVHVVLVDECSLQKIDGGLHLSPVHTGDKVEFDTVDFVESRQTRPSLSTRHTGDKVDRIGNKVDRIGNKVDRDKLSNSSCCRFVAKTGKKVDVSATKLTVSRTVTLLPVSATVDRVELNFVAWTNFNRLRLK